MQKKHFISLIPTSLFHAGIVFAAVSAGTCHAAEAAAPTSSPAALELVTWDDIKDYTFERRAEFAAGLRRMEMKMDSQAAELVAKRAKMKTDTKAWDFEMRGLNDARAYFKSLGTALKDASAEQWINDKEKIQRAWQTMLDAITKVKATTTS